jgi:hypothetical protein
MTTETKTPAEKAQSLADLAGRLERLERILVQMPICNGLPAFEEDPVSRDLKIWAIGLITGFFLYVALRNVLRNLSDE